MGGRGSTLSRALRVLPPSPPIRQGTPSMKQEPSHPPRPDAADGGIFSQVPLFVGGVGGCHTYRIPSLVVSNRGTLLAFCEGRRNGLSDTGSIDLLLRRSFDNGQTWKPARKIVDGGGNTAGNPAPVVERASDAVWLIFCRNAAEATEEMIMDGRAQRTVWATRSLDDGETWAPPREITDEVGRPSWTWYATGPGHGIQLRSGRLVIPCNHVPQVATQPYESGHAHVIVSDTGGANWRIGGIAQPGTSESTVVQATGGALYLNCRNYAGTHRRAYAWSRDDGDTFSEFGSDATLVEPVCQASLLRLGDAVPGREDWILFANPASTTRHTMTVRVSRDECRTWNCGRLLNAGRSGYSDLCVARDGSICCLYERGENSTYETITLACFSTDWLLAGDSAGG